LFLYSTGINNNNPGSNMSGGSQGMGGPGGKNNGNIITSC